MAPFARLVAATALALGASAATIRIDAGENGLTFTPNSVTAAVGDVLEFHFHPQAHSAVMGDFVGGCKPVASGGFSSGFVPTSSGESSTVFRVTVQNTNPIFFYCSQDEHCQNGMVGVVNPTAAMTLTGYMNNAKNGGATVQPAGVFGGELSSGASSSASGSTSAASGSATSGSATSSTFDSLSATSASVSAGSSASESATTEGPSVNASGPPPATSGSVSSTSAPTPVVVAGGGSSYGLSLLTGLFSVIIALLMA